MPKLKPISERLHVSSEQKLEYERKISEFIKFCDCKIVMLDLLLEGLKVLKAENRLTEKDSRLYNMAITYGLINE